MPFDSQTGWYETKIRIINHYLELYILRYFSTFGIVNGIKFTREKNVAYLVRFWLVCGEQFHARSKNESVMSRLQVFFYPERHNIQLVQCAWVAGVVDILEAFPILVRLEQSQNERAFQYLFGLLINWYILVSITVNWTRTHNVRLIPLHYSDRILFLCEMEQQ